MTKSQLHKIIIPKVPDRGGRTGELEPPPPEMPAFMQRKVSAHPQDQRHQHQSTFQKQNFISNVAYCLKKFSQLLKRPIIKNDAR